MQQVELRKKLKMHVGETITGYLFILPMLALTSLLVITPIILSAVISFTERRYSQIQYQIPYLGRLAELNEINCRR